VPEADQAQLHALARFVVDVADFPKPGILFRDITPLLREHFQEAVAALDALWSEREWSEAEAVAGVESRGFILAAALAGNRGKGFVPVRKKGKLPPPVMEREYALEYGTGSLEMQRGHGRLILVDDVLATGGTLGAAASLATDAGFLVLHTGVLIDLGIARKFRCLGETPRAVIRYGQ
jgi:adenine phosphoribosyltransferase